MRILISLFMLLFIGAAHAQFPYEASVLNEYYIPLDDPQSLEIEVGWDDPEVEIPLPFEFTVGGGEPMSMLLLSGTGEMLMGMSSAGLLDILWPISLDVMDIGAVEAEEFSLIQYQVTGEAPNRILKVEWNEVGLYEEISNQGSTTLRLNFQTWLYETDNIIEYRFGPNTISKGLPDTDFLTSGIILDFDYDYYDGLFYTASGAPADPTWTVSDDFYAWYYNGSMLDGIPAEGTVYRFGPITNAVNDPTLSMGIHCFPNPAQSHVWLSNEGGSEIAVQIYDSRGVRVEELLIQANQTASWNCSSVAPGTYLLVSQKEGEANRHQRIIIQ